MKKYFYCLLCVFAAGIVSLVIYFAVPKNKSNEELTINASNYSMQVGDKQEFVVLTNKNADLFFTVENSKIATLSSDSKYILANNVGKTSVKVLAKYKEQTEEISVAVEVTAKPSSQDDNLKDKNESDNDVDKNQNSQDSDGNESKDDNDGKNTMERNPEIPGGDHKPEKENPQEVVDGSSYKIKFVDTQNLRIENDNIYLLGKEVYFTVLGEDLALDELRIDIDVEGDYLKNIFNSTYKLICPDKSEFEMQITFIVNNKIVKKTYHVYNQYSQM